MRVWIPGIALVMALLPAGLPAAAGKDPVRAPDVDEYVAHQRALRRDVERGKRFAHVDEHTKRELFAAQDRVFAILDGHDSIEELTDQQSVDLYNAQNTINGVVADMELERQVCRREKHIGSNRVKLVCLSAREWREVHDNTQRDIRAPRVCNSPTTLGSAGVDPCNTGGG